MEEKKNVITATLCDKEYTFEICRKGIKNGWRYGLAYAFTSMNEENIVLNQFEINKGMWVASLEKHHGNLTPKRRIELLEEYEEEYDLTELLDELSLLVSNFIVENELENQPKKKQVVLR